MSVPVRSHTSPLHVALSPPTVVPVSHSQAGVRARLHRRQGANNSLFSLTLETVPAPIKPPKPSHRAAKKNLPAAEEKEMRAPFTALQKPSVKAEGVELCRGNDLYCRQKSSNASF